MKAKDAELAKEATEWADGTKTLDGWVDAPEAVPRYGESTPISIRMPKKMLSIIREFARRKGIGYQILMKQWLADRIRKEAKLYVRHLRRHDSKAIKLLEKELVLYAGSYRHKGFKLDSPRTSPVFHEAVSNEDCDEEV